MSEGIPYADIVIMALVAGFILLRLRSVLGRNDEGDGGFPRRPMPAERDEPVVRIGDGALKLPKPREEADPYLDALPPGAVADALKAIKVRDPNFSASQFLQGARGAYEMVFDAFAKGDRATLKMLMSPSLHDEFSRELDERDRQESKSETTLVSVEAREIAAAELRGNVATLTVRFAGEQVSVTRDKKGEVIEGDVSRINPVEDEWVFERDVTSKNPNWKIIET